MLAAIPEGESEGRPFPWQQKTGVYKWLRPLARGRCATTTSVTRNPS